MRHRVGVAVALAEELRPIYQDLGINLPDYNNDESWELPMAGTFVIDQEAMVRLAFADADYINRLEPAAILECLQSMHQS